MNHIMNQRKKNLQHIIFFKKNHNNINSVVNFNNVQNIINMMFINKTFQIFVCNLCNEIFF